MEQKLTKVFLHGRLGKLYGKEWNLAVKSPAEAIRAIDINVNGKLKEQLYKEGTSKYYKICLGNKDNALDKNELINPSGNIPIHIIPVIKGKKSGLGKILAAIAIIIITYYTFGAGSGLAAGEGVLGGTLTAGQATMIGYTMAASLIVGGITQMLTPVPNFNLSPDGDGRGSNIFQGNSFVTTQGSAVGLVYGRMMVTPMPVSLAFDNYDTPLPSVGDPDELEGTRDANGLIVYS